MISLTFKLENLVVDWISINIEGLKDSNSINRIATYFSYSLGFNFSFKIFLEIKKRF